MKRTIEVLNELERDGIVSRYAIGGAMAAMFYVEAVTTYDLDVFVVISGSSPILSLAPIYDRLRGMGYSPEAECIVIEGTPVQFLPAYNKLIDEALDQANELMYEDIPTRVMKVEHLIAICLQTGRAKDRERVLLFRGQGKINSSELDLILDRHGLKEKWQQWTS